MGIMMIGSINQYLKKAEMKQVWQMRKDNKDMPKGKMTLDEWVHDQQEKIKEPAKAEKNDQSAFPDLPEPPDLKMGNIEAKVNQGKRLTSEERSYLREHSPELLERADENERTRKNFEQELKRCRTKEDVERLKMKYVNASLTKVKAVINNPQIGQQKKLEICMEENGKVMSMERAAAAHVRSGAYAKLPTENEEHAAQAAEKEREEAQREEMAEAATPQVPEENQWEPVEDVEQETPQQAERSEEASRAETPEERKVKRAKRAAHTYRRYSAETDQELLAPVPAGRFNPPSAPSFTPPPENGTPPSTEWPGLDTKA